MAFIKYSGIEMESHGIFCWINWEKRSLSRALEWVPQFIRSEASTQMCPQVIRSHEGDNQFGQASSCNGTWPCAELKRAKKQEVWNHTVLAYIRHLQMSMTEEIQTPSLIHPWDKNSRPWDLERFWKKKKILMWPFILLWLHGLKA